jgi:hypothetical protein
MPTHQKLSGKKKWAKRPSSYCRWSHLSRTQIRNRTPSDFVIVAIFRDKRKPSTRRPRPFAGDFTAIKA